MRALLGHGRVKGITMATRQKDVRKGGRSRRCSSRGNGLRLVDPAGAERTPALYACVANRDWRDAGIASIVVARRRGAGRVSMAAFLVDIWAMGLKDAWGCLDQSSTAFDELLESMRDEMEVCHLDVTLARSLVYGGVALADELGFRLPRKYKTWMNVLGPLDEGAEPDMSLFRPDGKIRLLCSMHEFESRLVGVSPDQFLARDDVEWSSVDEDSFAEADDDVFDEAVADLEQQMIDRARQWCFSDGLIPHPLLPEVIRAALAAVIQSLPPDLAMDDDIDSLADIDRQAVSEITTSFLEATGKHNPLVIQEAIDQFDAFVRATGIDDEPLDSAENDV